MSAQRAAYIRERGRRNRITLPIRRVMKLIRTGIISSNDARNMLGLPPLKE